MNTETVFSFKRFYGLRIGLRLHHTSNCAVWKQWQLNFTTTRFRRQKSATDGTLFQNKGAALKFYFYLFNLPLDGRCFGNAGGCKKQSVC